MKILVLTSRVPWPLEKGDKLRIYHQLEELAKRHEIILCCLSDSKIHPDAEKKLENLCSEIHFFKLNKIKIGLRLLFAFLSSKPFQVHYFYQKSIKRKIHEIINKTEPKHIYCQLIRTSEYVKEIYSIKKTIDYMDAFSKGTQRREHNQNGLKRWLLREESKRLQGYENLIFEYFDAHTIISEQDKDCIKHPSKDSISIVSNGIDSAFFSPTPDTITYDIVFTGNMNYPPNRDGAVYIAKEIMPLLWKENPNRKLLIAGANDSPVVKALASENITVSGWMNDIRDAYNQSKIFVAPMQIGTGLQNKLLEAMSMNLACVTSTLANNALKAKDNKQVLIGNNPKDYAKKIELLLSDDELRKSIAKAGQEFVHRTYNWETSSKILEKLMLEA